MTFTEADLQDARVRAGRAQSDVDRLAHELLRQRHSNMSAHAADDALTKAANIRDEMVAWIRTIETDVKQQKFESR